jgi:HD superfamily phosphodiesterase
MINRLIEYCPISPMSLETFHVPSAQPLVRLNLTQKLTDFVQTTCEGRGPSHGYEHMQKVARNALEIFEGEEANIPPIRRPEVRLKIKIVAWLHDVADHKYDGDGNLKLRVKDFVSSICDKRTAGIILLIIDLISYSKENKAILEGNPINYEELLEEYDIWVRHIVSDADKLEALGKVGFERCREYSIHAYKEKYGSEPTPDILKKLINEHANEKLLRLKDQFVRTQTGKQMAEPLHEELVNELENLNRS